VTRDELIARIRDLSDAEFEKIAPWLVADLASVDHLGDLKAEIEAGRESAKTEPPLDHKEVVARARRTLGKD
jgi:hypothetical protein